ncbi:MAG: hypothetical protein JJ896_13370 [Rhodothermales bacterium]|nr:hypothetical protein [Rhodothermales bacterium]MBO6780637.1 hypothetical protein [Rhodothermales bacterium]
MNLGRNELYAIVSVVSAMAIAGFYLIVIVGWPGPDEPVTQGLKGPLLKTIGLAFLLEIVIEISRSGKVSMDERDLVIRGRSYRNAYIYLSVAVVAMLGHAAIYLFVMPDAFEPTGVYMFHFLVMALLTASAVNHGSRLFFYLRGA